MPVDLRLRHDRLLREQAVEMFERGFGYRLTAKRLGAPAEAVRHWQKTYRAIGKDGLLAMGVKRLFAFEGVGVVGGVGRVVVV